MWFTRISINNPVLATMMMLAFVVLGVFAYQRLQVDQFPDINFPVVVVQTEYPGASPEVWSQMFHARWKKRLTRSRVLVSSIHAAMKALAL